jgi:hypothetical protein
MLIYFQTNRPAITGWLWPLSLLTNNRLKWFESLLAERFQSFIWWTGSSAKISALWSNFTWTIGHPSRELSYVMLWRFKRCAVRISGYLFFKSLQCKLCLVISAVVDLDASGKLASFLFFCHYLLNTHQCLLNTWPAPLVIFYFMVLYKFE